MSTLDSTTLAPERFERIVAILNARRTVRVDELCAELKVSPATVRRDLHELDTQGRARKIHGGAVRAERLLEESVFDDKAAASAQEKRAIAQAALTHIQPNDCIYLDGGSTVLALAELLVATHPLTVVTNSLRVAVALSAASCRVILIGGDLRRLSQTFVGPMTQPPLEQIHVDKAFMGTLGLSVDTGMTTTDPAEAFTKRLAMQRASQVILLADSAKFGKVAFAQVGDWQDVDLLITDTGLDDHVERQLNRAGVEIIKAAAGRNPIAPSSARGDNAKE